MMNMMNIKKILALLLVLTMVVALPITAFAEGNATNGTNSGEGSGSFDINATISGKDNPTEAAVKISVDITWEEMKFTYTEGSVGVWDAANHEYTGGTDGTWSTNKPAISVKNHSNSVIQAQLSFSSDLGVSGRFYTESKDASGATVYNEITGASEIYLETAEGSSVAKAPEGKLHFGIDGSSAGITQSGKLGTITVAIAQSDKICGAASLLEAICSYEGKGGTITLDRDIDLRGEDPVLSVYFVGEYDIDKEPLVIDLGGHTIYGYLSFFYSNVVIKNGTVAFHSEDFDGLSEYVKNTLSQSGVITAVMTIMKLEDITLDTDIDGVDLETNKPIKGAMGLYNHQSVITTSGEFNVTGGTKIADNMYVGIVNESGDMTFSGEVNVDCCLFYTGRGSYITLTSGEGNTYSFNTYDTTVFGKLELDGADMDADVTFDTSDTPTNGIVIL